jgi:putative ABC transport system substrate-binding protein
VTQNDFPHPLTNARPFGILHGGPGSFGGRMSFDRLRRREFITLLGGAAAWPVAARAQQPAMPVVGFLSSQSPGPSDDSSLAAFRQGLAETGYIEGRNVAIDHRWADNQLDRLPALAADLLRRPLGVLVAEGPAVAAAKAATATVPIVFYTGADPVQIGLVASLNHPGGNLTGVTNVNVQLNPKRVELLHEVVPAATIIAALINPNNATAAETQSKQLQGAANALGLQLHILHASTEHDFDAAFATMIRLRAGGLAIGGDGFFVSRSQQLATLALRHGIPAVFQFRDFVAAGGLMSYGGSGTGQFRQVGVYAGRILKGEKPGDLPVQQNSSVELMINMNTAKALGLTVPLALLTRADEVIE